MKGTIIVAESGGDIPEDIASAYDIKILPMHISMGGESFDDGNNFPVETIFEYHNKTGDLPKTSATNPDEYKDLFENLHKEHPDK